MKAYCLASSSSGNAYIIETGDSTLLIECGISMNDIYSKCNSLGINFSKVDCCLITHAHGDHCCSAKHIERLGIPIFATKSTLERAKVKGRAITPLEPIKVAKSVYILAFIVNHDIEGAVGFVIKSKDETIIFINDSKSWNDDLRNFKPDYVFIECNYDHKMVHTQLRDLKRKVNDDSLFGGVSKEDIAKISQHERNINAHQSLASCIKGLHKLILTNCKCIFLMHLSDRYANEYKMKNAIQNEFGIKTLVCGKKGGIK